MPKYCCDRMRADLEHVCSQHRDRFSCPDALVSYTAKFDEFGLIVHDGARSEVRIAYCPWCGTRLPDSRRDQWFAELERRGIDPLAGTIPVEFENDAWFLGSS